MSQWAEVRQMHLVDKRPRKEIARRLGLDVKTVRRAVASSEPSGERRSPERDRTLDVHRARIEALLKADPALSAKRIRKVLLGEVKPKPVLPPRTVRHYVAWLRGTLFAKEAFVHRTHAFGDTMEVDFFEAWATIGGVLRKVRVVAATLPASNAHFARAYLVERLECLLDGIAAAIRHFGGVPRRLVLDNTSLAVRRVLTGREREETKGFQAFRGVYPVEIDYCAPAKGWEKGSVEGAAKYVRNNAFRPMPKVASLAELNEQILRELDDDLDDRRLPDGTTVRAAWAEERGHLRPLPARDPETCRRLSRVADKFGHVRLDRVGYSVPIRFAYRAVWVKAFHDRVEIAVDSETVATHARSFTEGAKVLDARHVLPLLEKKHRAVSEATAIQQWSLAPAFQDLRAALRRATRKPDQEWVRVLRLTETHDEGDVEAAVKEATAQGSPRFETIRLLLRRKGEPPAAPLVRVPVARPDLAAMDVVAPVLEAYDRLGEACA